MAYDLGQNCQQYENGINKSGEEQRERNEGGCRQKKKREGAEREMGQDRMKARETKRVEHTSRREEERSCGQM